MNTASLKIAPLKTATRKSRWLWIALACTLAASAWLALGDGDRAGHDSSEGLLATKRVRASALSTATSPARIAVRQHMAAPPAGLRQPITTTPHDLFAIEPSKERAQAQATAPVSQMPPLPFIYAGKLMEGDQYLVFLSEGDRNLAVHAGDVIDGAWRVQHVQPPQLQLRYLPLKMDATLDIGESN